MVSHLYIVTHGTLTVKIEQVPLLDIILIDLSKKTGACKAKIREGIDAIQWNLIYNEPVIYRAILFAQKAQVSVEAKHQKGISCNPRRSVGTARYAGLILIQNFL